MNSQCFNALIIQCITAFIDRVDLVVQVEPVN